MHDPRTMDPPPPPRILVVDDDPIDRMAVARSFGKLAPDTVVRYAENLAEARRALAAGEADLVILDYDLGPLERGTDLLDPEPEVPVVIVTGHGSEDVAIEAMRHNVRDYVVKDMQGKYLGVLPGIARAAMDRWAVARSDKEHIEEMRTTLRQYEDLLGLIPICCVCRKIRNQENKWESLEDFLRRWTRAKFSHGYCPTCLEVEMKALDKDRRRET